MKHRYQAPWSKKLVVMSAFAFLVLMAVAALGFSRSTGWVWAMPPTIAVVCALFAIRGYTVTESAILVHRLLWSTRLPLAGLESAKFEPDAMQRSIRICGNGGMFSFSGFYRNPTLGVYRALVTDERRTVVLRYAKRTVVLSPGEPEKFVQTVLDARPAA